MTDEAVPSADIMVVDDNPANLKLLEDMLGQNNYEVRSFPLGRLALAAAAQTPPDLILLDINMPEMNGYEVCARLKSDPKLTGIPVIFLSALDTSDDKVKGFRSGGVDYVSKPFQFEEVLARVETHIKLRRAQQTEHDLLEKTLSGAVKGLWELVQLTSPLLAVRSHSIRETVRWITTKLALPDTWQFELAATLCLVGCITLPDDTFERCYSDNKPSPEEREMFLRHPEAAARLVCHIPRLAEVAEMIRYQLVPEASGTASERVKTGARLLYLALELDQRISRGIHFRLALGELKSSLASRVDPRMIDALADYAPITTDYDLRSLPIRELGAGMILGKDIFSTTGHLLVLKEGTVLTDTWIDRLENFAKRRGVVDLVPVRVPRSARS